MTRRGHDQIAGLANGHEIPHHVGMGHGHRASGIDLRLEFRNNRTIGGEHVTETHGDQTHRGPRGLRAQGQISVERLTIHFGKALGGAQHGDRFDRLVGRDHHHGGRAGGGCRIGDIDRAEDVGLDALLPVLLKQRYVFQRRGVEDDVRLEVGHQAEHSGPITHVGNPPFDLRPRLLRCQGFEHGVQCRLGILDDQQPRGAEGDDAITYFGAD